MNLSDIINNSLACEEQYGVIVDWKATTLKVFQGTQQLDAKFKEELEQHKKTIKDITQDLVMLESHAPRRYVLAAKKAVMEMRAATPDTVQPPAGTDTPQ